MWESPCQKTLAYVSYYTLWHYRLSMYFSSYASLLVYLIAYAFGLLCFIRCFLVKLYILFNRLISTLLPSWWWIKMYIWRITASRISLNKFFLTMANWFFYLINTKIFTNFTTGVFGNTRGNISRGYFMESLITTTRQDKGVRRDGNAVISCKGNMPRIRTAKGKRWRLWGHHS